MGREVVGLRDSKTRWRRAMTKQGKCGKFNMGRHRRDQKGKRKKVEEGRKWDEE